MIYSSQATRSAVKTDEEDQAIEESSVEVVLEFKKEGQGLVIS